LATRVYILIQTTVGKATEVAQALEGLKMMTSVDTVTGPFNIIGVAEAENLKSIGDLISDGMHRISGIEKTITCISVKN